MAQVFQSYSVGQGQTTYSISKEYPASSAYWRTFEGKKGQTSYAVKRLERSVKSEKMLCKLKSVTNHLLIVHFVEQFAHSNFHYWVFEQCRENAKEYMDKAKLAKRKFSLDREIIPWVTEVCIALTHLHEHGVVHSSLKPSNIFFCELPGGETRVKISDYQAWNVIESNGSWVNEYLEPTSCYNAPETWPLKDNHNACYRSNIDVWSLGCFAVELITGQPLFIFQSRDKTALKTKWDELKGQNFISLPSDCRVEIVQLVEKMLLFDPELRPNSHEVLHQLDICGGPRVQTRIKSFVPQGMEIVYTPPQNVVQVNASNLVLEPDLNGVYPPVDWSGDLRDWDTIADGGVAQLKFPLMRLSHPKVPNRILEMVIVKRMRSNPPNVVPQESNVGEAADVTSCIGANYSHLVAKDLRVWARLGDDGPSDDLQISINLVLPSAVNTMKASVTLQKTRTMTVDNKFKNVFLHFQPLGMKLLPSESPKATVKVQRMS